MPEYRTQQVGEESVRYVHQGSGHPLLFMHGFSIRPHFYEKLIDALSEEHEVIAPEMYGINAFKDQPATMDEYAELTKEFVQAMHLGSHNMAGHSMGGGVAIMLAPDSANDTRLALMEPMCPIDFKYVASESFLRVVYKTARQLKGSTGGLDATIFGLKGMGFTTDLAKNVTATLGIVRDIVNFTHEKGFPRSTLYFMTEDDEMLPYTDELRDELRKDENVDLRILEGNVGHDWPVIIPNVYDSAKRINDFLTGDEMTEKLLNNSYQAF